ncbi:protein translocase subunit SecE [Kurthia zopfii]|uniref:Protein translocase subunit SecE n=1 Tax=Kurthia zopfii TaxID=1650 RepID=A0A2U3AC63_9BACL|nr:preprotein translocase subunit SecE [Kurthia zopfii]PWI22144.1 preprotein translocase subunit SecE [Kurthia zopfii]TDR37026.1 preprotein translocase subunit SecE [Kurthia zopfii]STX11150.1 Preprotein translocase subunit secE [Kurthia zopfii]VEI05492.1 Preprotein translocase subunit secE [Kurthia zopfii]GEK30802.1 protein translocase subunit SecE [Kurthia zopfii]
MAKLKQFFKDVLSEMRKTSWPKRKELSKYTLVVVSTLIFMAVFFVLVDLGISKLFRMYLDL